MSEPNVNAIPSARAAGRSRTHKVTVTAMLSAVAFVLMFIEFPIPALIPAFVKLDISDLPELLAAFSLGPVYGVVVAFLKNLLFAVLHGTSSAYVGELFNFLMGSVFAFSAGFVYQRNKSRRGALLGAVIGASQTGKAEGALAGAAIGAGAGAGASYLVAKYNNERDDRVRLASYARDLNADVNSLNRVTAAGQVAYNCYSAKFRAALEDYKAKRITRAELDQRYAEIKSGLAEASAILGSTLSEADKREAEYRQVLTIEAKKASRPIPPVQTVATTSKKTSKATKTVTRKQTGDQLQNLSNGVGSYKESTAQLTAVKSDLDEIQLQMDKVMLAQG